MRAKGIWIWGLLWLMALPLAAQTSETDYTARLAEFGTALSKNPRNVAAAFGLAQFYFDKANPMYDLPTAMSYATLAEEQHVKLLKNDKISELSKLQRDGITIQNIHQLREAIANTAIEAVRTRNDMTLGEIDRYQEAFGTLADVAKQLRAKRMQCIYQQTLTHGTPDQCYAFTQTYAGTQEARVVEHQLGVILDEQIEALTTPDQILALRDRYPNSTTVTAHCNKRLATLRYRQAEQQGTLEAYRAFVAEFPASNEAEAARTEIDRLVEADFAHRHTTLQLAHFADSNADSPLADKALARMRKLIYKNHDIAAAHYYVNHYQLDEHYNEVFRTYYSWYADEGNGTPIRHFFDQNSSFPYVNAYEDDLEKADAIDAVDFTRPYADSLYLEYSDMVRNFMGKRIAIVPLQRMLQKPLRDNNYAAATSLAQEFEICFDNRYRDDYTAMLRIIGTVPAIRAVQTLLTDSTDIRHPAINPTDGMLYFSDGRYIRRAERKGNRWIMADTVHFANTGDAALDFYGFYQNGQRMVLGNDGDIWLAEREGDQWRVSDIPPYPVNTDYIETDAYMMPDGSGMLLASDRPGGYNLQPSGSPFHGDTALATDLYFIPYGSHGWGTPVNLGLSVNSLYSERSPLLSKNLRTLYFISDAPGGLGYGDVYVCERENNADWTTWTKPRNLGREVNSPLHETSITFGANERTIVMATDAHGLHAARSFPTTHDATTGSRQVKIDITDAAPQLLRMQMVDLSKQAVAQVVDYEGDTNIVGFTVDNTHRYALMADAGNMLAVTTLVDSNTAAPMRMPAYTYNELVAMDRTIDLPLITTRRGSSELQPLAIEQLRQLARFVKHHPRCILEFLIDAGDDDTRQAYNTTLQIGNAIRHQLTENGLAPDHIVISPYGNARLKRSGQQRVSVRFRE